MVTKRLFLNFPIAKQHKKCAEALRKSDLDTYAKYQLWLGLEPLPDGQEALSNRYHYHLKAAGHGHKEHNLLITQGDKASGQEAWPIAIYLDQLRSAHNVGSIVRTCEALSLGTLYFSPGTPSLDHPQVQKTAMGAAAWVKTALCEQIEQLPRPIVALETAAEAVSLYEFAFPEAFTLAIGNEEYGLSTSLLEAADYLVKIPLRGRKNSLNVANAFAIAAAEIQRQRGLCRSS